MSLVHVADQGRRVVVVVPPVLRRVIRSAVRDASAELLKSGQLAAAMGRQAALVQLHEVLRPPFECPPRYDVTRAGHSVLLSEMQQFVLENALAVPAGRREIRYKADLVDVDVSSAEGEPAESAPREADDLTSWKKTPVDRGCRAARSDLRDECPRTDDPERHRLHEIAVRIEVMQRVLVSDPSRVLRAQFSLEWLAQHPTLRTIPEVETTPASVLLDEGACIGAVRLGLADNEWRETIPTGPCRDLESLIGASTQGETLLVDRRLEGVE